MTCGGAVWAERDDPRRGETGVVGRFGSGGGRAEPTQRLRGVQPPRACCCPRYEYSSCAQVCLSGPVTSSAVHSTPCEFVSAECDRDHCARSRPRRSTHLEINGPRAPADHRPSG
ncbi:hypothetical protein D7I43_08915 [Micromonospora globbae]|uniref:Uncharacterized protein n=1 Tax=Micromonospora globbae TaxID=1894969 RepID=A0A420F4D9_9ACTN|nr:hypothetical protein D7I43_08915 [Micromonospora globbae]